MQPLAYLRIDSNALRDNFAAVKRLAPQSRVLAMVKADAYGHGLLATAKALNAADGFGVARIEEAVQLRVNGITQKIVLLNPSCDKETLQYCAENAIDLVVFNHELVELIAQTSLVKPFNIWLKVDTGMHRLGLAPDVIAQHFHTLKNLPQINNITLMTHFSDAENPNQMLTQTQTDYFNKTCSELSAERSLANSAAIMQSPTTHADWIRPGIMLYGASPLKNSPIDLKPVMHLHSRVLSLRDIDAGESVGYNQTWTATRPSCIATIAIGYGDGYPRHAKNSTPVLINGQQFPLVGRVSMDLITVDVTDGKNIQCGDEVTLWGTDSAGNTLSANIIADYANTISYDLFTGVTARVQRQIIN
jgi:alanine racemase